MLWNDLREYLQRLDELGELKTVVEASWEEDIGGISELMIEREGPALVFDDIPGYPPGYRVGANLFGTPRRTAISLGLEDAPSQQAALERWADITEKITPVPWQVVESGPVFENVMQGDQIDLFRFPTPKWHENDGGRYIGTGVCVIERDPETGFVNVGAYRVSVQEKGTCGIFMEHSKHGDAIRRKYWERGEKCPVVVTVGQEPVLTALSGSQVYRVGDGISELEVAGYLQGEPYKVVLGPTTGIPIPATAEIAIEGFMPSPGDALMLEGPFGEWTGYYAHGRRPEAIIEVSAIYHRNDPIIFGAPPTRPIGGYWFTTLGRDSIGTKRRLERAGIPGIKRVYSLGSPNMGAISLKQSYAGQIDDLIRVLEPGGDQYSGHHIWILVDDDIDVSKPDELFWAMASRCSPEDNGVRVIPATGIWQLDPRLTPEERSNPDEVGARKRYQADNLIINTCRPFEWMQDFPPVNVNGPELRARVLDRWKDLFE